MFCLFDGGTKSPSIFLAIFCFLFDWVLISISKSTSLFDWIYGGGICDGWICDGWICDGGEVMILDCISSIVS